MAWQLLIYLNGGEGPAEAAAGPGDDDHPLVGGETVFWRTKSKQLCVFQPRRGTALLHAHGRRCLMHEAAEVQKGLKYHRRRVTIDHDQTSVVRSRVGSD
eukprot:COSAG01_NODE_963_length_12407_cov_38.330598_7_plen_100_part_00